MGIFDEIFATPVPPQSVIPQPRGIPRRKDQAIQRSRLRDCYQMQFVGLPEKQRGGAEDRCGEDKTDLGEVVSKGNEFDD